MYLFPFINPQLNTFFNTSVKKVKSYHITELEDQYQITIDALGRHLSDIEVKVSGQTLHVDLPNSDLLPEKSQVKRVVWQELDLESKSYTFTLNQHIDLTRIEAKLNQGRLVITLHKKEIETYSIPVQAK